MQCCGQILKDSFETYKTFPRWIITEFECKVDVQNRPLWWIGFNYNRKMYQNSDILDI